MIFYDGRQHLCESQGVSWCPRSDTPLFASNEAFDGCKLTIRESVHVYPYEGADIPEEACRKYRQGHDANHDARDRLGRKRGL